MKCLSKKTLALLTTGVLLFSSSSVLAAEVPGNPDAVATAASMQTRSIDFPIVLNSYTWTPTSFKAHVSLDLSSFDQEYSNIRMPSNRIKIQQKKASGEIINLAGGSSDSYDTNMDISCTGSFSSGDTLYVTCKFNGFFCDTIDGTPFEYIDSEQTFTFVFPY